MSTGCTGITGDAGSSSIDTERGLITPCPGGGGGSIEKDFGYIAREGWWGGPIACIALVFALSGCVALPDTECLRVGPAYTCEAEHGNGFVGSALDRPSRPDVPDVPDDDQCNDGDTGSDRDDKPGWGRGDKNHDHSGPPGLDK